MPEITRGGYYIIANNMGSAFVAGDRVLVEDINPDPNRPEYKYVVLSPRDQKRYLLSDADLTPVSPSITQPMGRQPAPEAHARKQKEPKKSSNLTKVLLVILLLIVFAAGGFVVGRVTYEPKTKTRTVVRTVTKPSSTPATSSSTNPSSTSTTGSAPVTTTDPSQLIQSYLSQQGVNTSGINWIAPLTSKSDPNWEIIGGSLPTGTYYFLLHKVNGNWTVVGYGPSNFTAAQLQTYGAPNDFSTTSSPNSSSTSP